MNKTIENVPLTSFFIAEILILVSSYAYKYSTPTCQLNRHCVQTIWQWYVFIMLNERFFKVKERALLDN